MYKVAFARPFDDCEELLSWEAITKESCDWDEEMLVFDFEYCYDSTLASFVECIQEEEFYPTNTAYIQDRDQIAIIGCENWDGFGDLTGAVVRDPSQVSFGKQLSSLVIIEIWNRRTMTVREIWMEMNAGDEALAKEEWACA